jgi:methionyl-tRNA formyltransferase
MSIVFVGTPAFAVPSLRRLAAAGHDISAVVTQPDRPAGRGRRPAPPPVKLAAQELGLTVLQPETLRDPLVVSQIAALAPQAIVAVAYGQILRPEVLDIAPKGVINVHPSLLPRWRGASPIASAVLAGDEDTGVTIMLMDPGLDTGPILAQEHAPIAPTDTAGSLTEKLSHLGADLLVRTLPRWLTGEIQPEPQDASQATTCRLVRKEDGAIDWTLPALEVWRRVRAYNPWPGAHTTMAGELLHIWEAWPLDSPAGPPPGTVVALSPGQGAALPAFATEAAFAVQTGEGLLAIARVQRAGRRALSATEFLRGLPNFIGRRLGTGDTATG